MDLDEMKEAILMWAAWVLVGGIGFAFWFYIMALIGAALPG